MNRASQSIQLVLIGSACILMGCRDSSPGNQAAASQPSGATSGRGHHPAYWFSGASRTGRSPGATSSGLRGGFGSTGRAVGA